MRPEIKALFTGDRMDWATPWDFFQEQTAKYGAFDLDVCATAESAKCRKYFSPEDDALSRPWSGNCWMNPPYGRSIGRWIHKAWLEACVLGNVRVVCLLPARTDTAWWHNYVLKFAAHIEFIRGRIKFTGALNNAPFPSVVAVFEPREGGPYADDKN